MGKWLCKGDRVVAIAGNEKGKMGKVLRRRKDRVVVEGLNLRKKHVKATQENPSGNILEIEAPIHISNLRPCSGDGKAVKLRVRLGDKGEKKLVYLEGGKEVAYKTVKKS